MDKHLNCDEPVVIVTWDLKDRLHIFKVVLFNHCPWLGGRGWGGGDLDYSY